MLKVMVNQSGQLTGERTKKHVFPAGEGQSFECELYEPDAVEHLDFIGKFKLGTSKPDFDGAVKFVARNWFRSFDNVAGDDGNPLPNTEAVRIALLKVPNLGLLNWMLPLFQKAANKDVEGKDGAASD